MPHAYTTTAAPIAFRGLTKRYPRVTAVDAVTADIQPGRVTAFLGANGSGKTTSMPALLGLITPTSGSALVNGHPYRWLHHPTRAVGAVLDQGLHPNRTARAHLRIVAMQAGMPPVRADELLDTMRLTEAADRRVGGFSLGMRQRLLLAAALVGDPAILVLDEPFNGLDPDGIQSTRTFLSDFARRGGTVLLSSHLLGEISHVADDALILDHGRLVGSGPLDSLVTGPSVVVVTTPDATVLADAVARRGASVSMSATTEIVVTGLDAYAIGRAAADAGVAITGMRERADDLETIFRTLVHQEVAA
jgi:ABC-2 type transport system ATP-binding protein